jgi:hypothetical protein
MNAKITHSCRCTCARQPAEGRHKRVTLMKKALRLDWFASEIKAFEDARKNLSLIIGTAGGPFSPLTTNIYLHEAEHREKIADVEDGERPPFRREGGPGDATRPGTGRARSSWGKPYGIDRSEPPDLFFRPTMAGSLPDLDARKVVDSHLHKLHTHEAVNSRTVQTFRQGGGQP